MVYCFKYYIRKYKTRDPFIIARELATLEFNKFISNSPRGMFKKILKNLF